MLSDNQIKEEIKNKNILINPFVDNFLGPNLYYCHLGINFLIPKKGKPLNPLRDNSEKYFDKLILTKPFKLLPQQFILAETFESFGISSDYVIKLYNSSSLARCGVLHTALGMINPGCGIKSPVKITLELCNLFPVPIILTPTIIKKDNLVEWGTEVLKIGVEKMDSTPTNSYDNWEYAVYGKDTKVMSSKMNNRFNQKTIKITNYKK